MGFMDKISEIEEKTNGFKGILSATKICGSCGYKIPIDAEVCPLCKKSPEGSEEERIKKEKKEQERIQLEKIANGVTLLTTCPTIEGYRIVETYGVVYGETVFKAGFLKTLGQSIANIADAVFTFGDLELSGSAEMIKDARAFAERKLKVEAGKLGANAVVGIDSESSFGGQLMHVTIYGTAVKVEKI